MDVDSSEREIANMGREVEMTETVVETQIEATTSKHYRKLAQSHQV